MYHTNLFNILKQGDSIFMVQTLSVGIGHSNNHLFYRNILAQIKRWGTNIRGAICPFCYFGNCHSHQKIPILLFYLLKTYIS